MLAEVLQAEGSRWLSTAALDIADADADRDTAAPGDVVSRRTFAIAHTTGAPAGFVRIETTKAGLGYATVYVTPNARRKGAGSFGLRFVASLDDVVALEAVVHPDNDDALRCCARAGFAADGRRAGEFLVLGRMGAQHGV